MQNYTLTCLITSELDEKGIEELVEKLKGLTGAINEIKPKRIRLAYPIEKKTEAFLLSLSFAMEPDKITELKKELEKITLVIRFLLLKQAIVKKAKERKPLLKTASAQPVVEKATARKEKKKVALEDIEKDLEKILDGA